MISSLKTLFSSWKRISLYIILVGIATWIWWQFTDIKIMKGNYGSLHTYIDVFLSGIMILGFPLFLLAFLYRGYALGNKNHLHKKAGVGMMGGILGTIISGSSCCGLTLASYFGLLPLMSFLPYSGLEIKILGAAGLLYGIYELLKHLESCNIKRRHI